MAKVKLLKSFARALPPKQWRPARGSFPRLPRGRRRGLCRKREDQASITDIVDYAIYKMRHLAPIKAEMWQGH
jgi:hypothetical protein